MFRKSIKKSIDETIEQRSGKKRENGFQNNAQSSSGGVPTAPRMRQNRSREPSERGKNRPRPFENLKESANGSVRAQKVRCEPQRKAQRVGMPEASIGIIVRDFFWPTFKFWLHCILHHTYIGGEAPLRSKRQNTM